MRKPTTKPDPFLEEASALARAVILAALKGRDGEARALQRLLDAHRLKARTALVRELQATAESLTRAQAEGFPVAAAVAAVQGAVVAMRAGRRAQDFGSEN